MFVTFFPPSLGESFGHLRLGRVQRHKQLIGPLQDLGLCRRGIGARRRLDLIDRVRDATDRTANAFGVFLVRNGLRPGHRRGAEHESGGEQRENVAPQQLPHETPLSTVASWCRTAADRA
jgi:hypothetical protein